MDESEADAFVPSKEAVAAAIASLRQVPASIRGVWATPTRLGIEDTDPRSAVDPESRNKRVKRVKVRGMDRVAQTRLVSVGVMIDHAVDQNESPPHLPVILYGYLSRLLNPPLPPESAVALSDPRAYLRLLASTSPAWFYTTNGHVFECDFIYSQAENVLHLDEKRASLYWSANRVSVVVESAPTFLVGRRRPLLKGLLLDFASLFEQEKAQVHLKDMAHIVPYMLAFGATVWGMAPSFVSKEWADGWKADVMSSPIPSDVFLDMHPNILDLLPFDMDPTYEALGRLMVSLLEYPELVALNGNVSVHDCVTAMFTALVAHNAMVAELVFRSTGGVIHDVDLGALMVWDEDALDSVNYTKATVRDLERLVDHPVLGQKLDRIYTQPHGPGTRLVTARALARNYLETVSSRRSHAMHTRRFDEYTRKAVSLYIALASQWGVPEASDLLGDAAPHVTVRAFERGILSTLQENSGKVARIILSTGEEITSMLTVNVHEYEGEAIAAASIVLGGRRCAVIAVYPRDRAIELWELMLVARRDSCAVSRHITLAFVMQFIFDLVTASGEETEVQLVDASSFPESRLGHVGKQVPYLLAYGETFYSKEAGMTPGVGLDFVRARELWEKHHRDLVDLSNFPEIRAVLPSDRYTYQEMGALLIDVFTYPYLLDEELREVLRPLTTLVFWKDAPLVDFFIQAIKMSGHQRIVRPGTTFVRGARR